MISTDCDNGELMPEAKMTEWPHVAVLLCTYHGEKYLRAQLKSLMEQDYPNFSVWASDDSRDGRTKEILEEYKHARRDVSLRVYSGPRKGSSENFLGLLSFDQIDAKYFAFCDQDDVWKPNKVSRSVEALEAVSDAQPALYCARVELIDEHGKSIGFSPLFKKPPSFSNALVQSLAGGNTMMLNRKARDVVAAAGVPQVVVHDWWIYQLLTGIGGTVIYDQEPTLLYRQHSNNEIGGDQSLSARFMRLVSLFRRQHQEWHELNIQALKRFEDWLTHDNRELLNQFESCRHGSLGRRLISARDFPFVRQTTLGSLSLYLALILKRL